MSTWDAVITSAPINRAARSVVSQRRCAEADESMGREELKELMERLARKQRLLKLVLGVKTRAQHANLVAALKGKHYGSGKFRAYGNPRAAVEYKRIGEEIQRINRALQDMNAAKTGKQGEKHGWRG